MRNGWILILFMAHGLASDSQRLVGSFYTKKSGANFSQFFIFESKGEKLAFPVEFKNEKIKK